MDILADAQSKFVKVIFQSVKDCYNVEIPAEMEGILSKSMSRPRSRGQGEFMFPCSSLCKLVTGAKPNEIAVVLSDHINNTIQSAPEYSEVFESTTPNGVYVNLKLLAKYFGSVINSINHGKFLDPLPRTTQEKVMIEYSQPNTHKAFHVGHMRNVALGGSIIRLFEQMGHEVVTANYLGDEGVHVSKCLWLLCQRMKEQGKTLEQLDVPADRKGEYLGKVYAEANDLLDLRSLTRYPYPNIVAARVVKKEKHPAADAAANWHVCTVDFGAEQPATVVCVGIGYEAGDMIAYIPVGSKLKKQLIAPRNMKGIHSCGMMLGYSELGATAPKERVQKIKASLPQDDGATAKGKKGKKSGAPPMESSIIIVLEEDCKPGQLLVEIGKLDKSNPVSVTEEHNRKKKEVDDVLRKLEAGDKAMTELWQKTKQWSFDDFKTIYNWLEARFDNYFFESDVSEESRHLVLDNYKLSPEEGGVMVESNGAIGCDLSMFNLPFLILIKSNGAGLYATKDLSLAQHKFRDFKIERSIYIVDSAQTLHFQQVFACLERLGYEQAKKCFHLSYGQVVGPNGKMSSRDGTVIYFNDLKEQLADEIMATYLEKYKGVWSEEEILNVQHQIALATIKYRMLNQDPIKDIVFVLKEWTAKTGDTGPYLCYAYARIKAIMAKADKPENAKIDLSLLNSDHDRSLLYAINNFWSIIEKSAYEYKPNTVCKYLYELSKDFNSWYEVSPVNTAETDDLKLTRLEFIAAVSAIIKKSLYLLGINAVDRM